MLSGNGLAQVIPLLIAPILSRIYTPADFGGYANFMAILGIFIIIACGRMELAIMLPALREETLDVIRRCLRFLVWVCGLALVCSVFFSGCLSELFESPDIETYLRVLPLFIIFNGIYAIVYNWLNRAGKYKLIASSKLIMAVVVGLVNLIMGFSGYGVAGLILANLAGLAVMVLLFNKTIIEIWKGLRSRKDEPMEYIDKRYYDFPRTNMAHAFFDVLNQQFLFNLIFTSLFGVTAMGLYALSYRYIRAPMRIFNTSISQVYYKEAADLKKQDKPFTRLLLKTIGTTAVFAFPMLFILILFAPQLFAIVFGAEWYEAGEYARALSPAIICQFLVSPISMTPIICNKQRIFFIWSVFGQASSLLLIYILRTQFDLSVTDCLWGYSSLLSINSLITLAWFYRISALSHLSYD